MEETNVIFSAPLKQLMDEHVLLREEMDLFYELTEEIECDSGPVVVQLFEELYRQVSSFTEKLKQHSNREEESLFPMLRSHLREDDRTIEVMEQEHEKAEQHLHAFLKEAGAKGTTIDEDDAQWITVSAVQAYATLTQHFAKEEKVLFPLAEMILSVDEMEQLEQMFQEK